MDEEDPGHSEVHSEDPYINSLLTEEQARKRAKKAPDGDPASKKKKKKKGLTLEEVEEMEGGVVRESKIGMAASKRADQRKKKAAGDETEIMPVGDLVEVEEALEVEEDDGIKLEPFNLAREREEGFFDESGNYVERKEEEDPADRDAWLTSDDAKVVSDEVRQRLEQQQARQREADAAPEITPRQAADLKRKIVAILAPGETVTRALKRLRPQAPAAGKKGKRKEPKTEETEAEKQAKMAFEELTEAASTLLDAGELDIYTISRRELEMDAAEFPEEKDDFDMFGDLDDALPPAATVADNGTGPPDNGGTANAEADATESADAGPPFRRREAPQVHAQAVEEVDYNSWPVKELSRFLKERGQDTAGIVDKEDLVARVREVASQGPEGEQPEPPDGYIWDPESSYFYSSKAGLYWDAKSSSFYSPNDGKWYSYDTQRGQFQELPA